jgi:RNA-binding protein YlmH
MDKNQIIEKFATNPEHKIMLSHIYDLALRRDDRNVLTASNFMSDNESALTESFLRSISAENYIIYGGYNDAERKIAVFLPDYYTDEDVYNAPMLAEICYVTVSVNKYQAKSADISHRDVLGTLMGFGIERNSIGDIVVDGGFAVFIIKSKLAEFIKENLVKIGRYQVDLCVYDCYNVLPSHDYETFFDTVASMRLDAVVASVFKLSRGSASESISRGIVSINGAVCTKQYVTVKEGDKITLRGKGKAKIDKLEGMSKKGRIRFVYNRYK